MQNSLANFSCQNFSLLLITLHGLALCRHPLAPQLLHYHRQSLVEAGCQLQWWIINQIIKNMVWQPKEKTILKQSIQNKVTAMNNFDFQIISFYIDDSKVLYKKFSWISNICLTQISLFFA